MTGAIDAGSIRVLLARPAVLRTFVVALLGRLAYGVLPLCFLFTVRDSSDSFTSAAAASAALGLATLAMPLQARLTDRYGQRRVLPGYVVGYAATLLGAFLVSHTAPPPTVWLGLGLLVGLTTPALGPATRAQWREIAAEGPERRNAYSLDSIGEEAVFFVGPLVAAGLLAVGPARWGLLLVIALVACGVLALTSSPHRPAPAARPAATEGGRRRRGVLRPLGGLMASMYLFGVTLAAVFVGIAAMADRAGRPELAGIVEAAMAVGAVVGGLLWARFGATKSTRRTHARLLWCVTAAYLTAAVLAPHLTLVAAALAVGALGTSPVFVVAFATADNLVTAGQRTEASTWVTVALNAGVATGTAAAGLAAAMGTSAPFLLAAAMVALSGTVATRARRVISPSSTYAT